MSLITCGSIHEGHEWLSDESRGRHDKKFLCVWLLYYESNFADSRMEVPRGDQVLLHEIIFFSVYSAAVKCYAKMLLFGVNCLL